MKKSSLTSVYFLMYFNKKEVVALQGLCDSRSNAETEDSASFRRAVESSSITPWKKLMTRSWGTSGREGS